MRSSTVLLLIIFCFYFTSNLSAEEKSKSVEFCFSDVIKTAETESKKPYQAKKITIPKVVENMSYEQYGAIRYNPDYDLWYKENIPYRLSFFHLGMLYNTPVDIYEITDTNTIKPVPFSPDFFSCSTKDTISINKAMPKNAGYAGFKIYNPYPNELVVFLGSSYFRVISEGCSYGLSNRGIAVNTGLENVVEEFPAFEKFWLKKPKKINKELTIYAYLNGTSITGAYSFTIKPGKKVELDVKSVIFLRQKVKLLGFAPITSMFWFSSGIGITHNFNDYRPSVHNSEGLILSEKNVKIWEPLVNYPNYKVINDDIHCESTPNYFGLIQRNREYNFYMDPGVRYHLNPSCWIIPQGNWGAGKIRLFIFPTLHEWVDNVNAFWLPDKLPEIGKPYEFNYKIIYSLKEPETQLDYVKYTNIGVDLHNAKNTIFALSYNDSSGEIEKNYNKIKIKLETPKGIKIVSPPSIEKISFNNTWRVIFTLSSKKLDYSDNPYIIKVTLLVKDKPISETWYYQWYP